MVAGVNKERRNNKARVLIALHFGMYEACSDKNVFYCLTSLLYNNSFPLNYPF